MPNNFFRVSQIALVLVLSFHSSIFFLSFAVSSTDLVPPRLTSGQNKSQTMLAHVFCILFSAFPTFFFWSKVEIQNPYTFLTLFQITPSNPTLDEAGAFLPRFL